MKKAFLFAIVGAVASAPVSAQSDLADQRRVLDSTLAVRVAGCYELVADGWQSDSELAKIATIPTDPVRFELTGKAASGWAALSDMEHSVYFEVHSDSIARLGARPVYLVGPTTGRPTDNTRIAPASDGWLPTSSYSARG